MTIDKIAFEQLFPTGVYANQRFRAEGTLQEGDDIVECYKKLAGEVDRSFAAMHPEIVWSEINPQPTENEPVDKRIASLIEDINSCEVIDDKNSFGVQYGLIAFEKLAESHPELKAAYDLRLKQLTK